MNADLIKELLIRISQKDERAFNLLFDHYYPKLLQTALFFVSHKEAAREVVSELFYKLLKNPQTLTGIKDFDSYIFGCVRNQSNTYLKKNHHHCNLDVTNTKNHQPFTELKNPESILLSNELMILVEDTIQAMPPKRKAIFLLVKDSGKKYREVSEVLNISIKTVELQMSLALKFLRETISKYQKSKDIRVPL